VKIVKDPFGNKVCIDFSFMELQEQLIQSDDVFDDMTAVIEKPMMIFKMKEGAAELYYLRAIGWNKTMLVGVQKTDDHLEVINCQVDPTIERLTELHTRAERLI
jgi:hypothetical protein